MAKVHTKKKNKSGKQISCGRCGHHIAPGEEYFTWTPYKSSARIRCANHYPRQSELTGSDKLSRVYAANESIEDAMKSAREAWDMQIVIDALDEAYQELEEVKGEYEESHESMSQTFSESPTLDDMQEKIDNIDSYMNEIESAKGDIEGEWSDLESRKPENFNEPDCKEDEIEDWSNEFDDLMSKAEIDCPI